MASSAEADAVRPGFEDRAGRLGSAVVSQRPVGWGDGAATHRIELADGRVLAVRRIEGPGAGPIARHRASVMAGLAEAGLPVPRPTVLELETGTWLVTPWVDGRTGADWLDTPDRARTLARSMGLLARRLRGVDPAGLDLETSSAGSRAAADLATGWLDDPAVRLAPRTRAALADDIAWLRAADRWVPAFVHGDFAPINVIVDPVGGISALLDLEHAALGSPLADVAWWSWVVRHHHPSAWASSWTTFCEAAGVDGAPDGGAARELRAVRSLRSLRAVAEADDAATRAVWADRMDEAATW